MELSWDSLSSLLVSLGPLLGSLGFSWALLGLSWASLGLSWGSLGPLLGSLGPLLGLPEGVQKGSQKGTPKKSALEPIFCEFWSIFLGTCWIHFWVPFFDPVFLRFLAASWAPKVAQGAARRHLQAPKSAQKPCVFSCFLHIASFVALMLLRAFLGPLSVPTWPLQGRFWHPKWNPKRTHNENPK